MTALVCEFLENTYDSGGRRLRVFVCVTIKQFYDDIIRSCVLCLLSNLQNKAHNTTSVLESTTGAS